jgi:hypothetical protein
VEKEQESVPEKDLEQQLFFAVVFHVVFVQVSKEQQQQQLVLLDHPRPVWQLLERVQEEEKVVVVVQQ